MNDTLLKLIAKLLAAIAICSTLIVIQLSLIFTVLVYQYFNPAIYPSAALCTTDSDCEEKFPGSTTNSSLVPA